MKEVIVGGLLAIGALFTLVAAIGIVRMPDFFIRTSATAKASTLGTSLMLLAVAVEFQDAEIGIRAFAIIIFIFLTSPIAAHMLSRAAYTTGVPLWDKSHVDEMREHFARGDGRHGKERRGEVGLEED